MKRIFALALPLVLLAGCAQPQAVSSKLRVSVSIYPLAFLAQRIGGDEVSINQIVPDGVEPHEYEPLPKDVEIVLSSKVFLMGGSGIDGQFSALQAEFAREGVVMYNVAQHNDLMPLVDIRSEKDMDEVIASGKYPYGVEDPHFWLDPVLFERVARGMTEQFVILDPAHETLYRSRMEELGKDLHNLDGTYRSLLRHCAKNNVIVSHDAFRYLAKRYDFTTLALAGISPDEEPSPKTMTEIIDAARNQGLKVVFFETLVSPKLAEAVANGAGAQALVLNPIEGLTSAEIANGDTYLTIMQRNAENLSIALECQT